MARAKTTPGGRSKAKAPAERSPASKLLSEINELELLIADSPPLTDESTAAATLAHAEMETAYWRKMQSLASLCLRSPSVKGVSKSFITRAAQTLKLAKDSLVSWDQRWSVAYKAIQLDEVRKINARLDAMEGEADLMAGLED